MKKKLYLSAIVVIAAVGIYFGCNGLFMPDVPREIAVPKGAGVVKIAGILKENGVIKSKLMFRVFCSFSGKGGLLKNGKAIFSPKMSYPQIISVLENDMKSAVLITIPEGYELTQIAQLLEKNSNITKEQFFDEVENGSFDLPFISQLPKGENRLEGYLFPETYSLDEDTTAHTFIEMCLVQFQKVYTPEMEQQANSMGMTTNQLITLASIIEKESSSDRELVSSVFHNRLNSKKFKYLESCATVIYVTKTPKPRLSAQDIQVDSPYNTYNHAGLPPGPIASPGKESIEAALNPAKTDYYYFSDMGGGKNTFSRTYEEHLSKQN